MTSDKSSVYWRTDASWWYIGEDNQYHLTDKAPQEAIDSFELFCNPPDPKVHGV